MLQVQECLILSSGISDFWQEEVLAHNQALEQALVQIQTLHQALTGEKVLDDSSELVQHLLLQMKVPKSWSGAQSKSCLNMNEFIKIVKHRHELLQVG